MPENMRNAIWAHSSTLLRFRCPNHLNLHASPHMIRHTVYVCPKDYKSMLRFLSFGDTSPIHLAILSTQTILSAFIAHVPVPLCRHIGSNTVSIYMASYNCIYVVITYTIVLGNALSRSNSDQLYIIPLCVFVNIHLEFLVGSSISPLVFHQNMFSPWKENHSHPFN